MGYTQFDSILESNSNTSSITTDTTLTSTGSGMTYMVAGTSDITITLPATGTGGFHFRIVNAEEETTGTRNKLSVSPAVNDAIFGCELAKADNKDLINTSSTSHYGDMVELAADGASGYFITRLIGTWAKES
jgi:hypothetical protein